MTPIEFIKQDLVEVVSMLNNVLGSQSPSYASKNPDLVKFLMQKIQDEKRFQSEERISGWSK